MRVIAVGILVGLVALTVAPYAHADRASEAREHYQSATTHFAVGDFAKAADEYQAAYMLKPDPALLYNAAQSYRLAGNQEKALILYKNYVQLYPNEANVDEVRAQIAKLRDAIAAADKAKTSPPTDTREPKQPMKSEPAPAAAPVTASSPSASTTTESTSGLQAGGPAPERTPLYEKWWLWTIVGAVVAGGVITAAVLATSSNGTWTNAPEVGPGRMGLGVRW